MKKHWIQQNMTDEHLQDRTKTIADISPYECNLTQLVPIIGREKYFEMVGDVYGPQWTAATEIIPRALEGIQELSQVGDVHVVTARRAWEVKNTTDWLQAKGFSPYVKSIIYLDDPRYSNTQDVAGSRKVGLALHLGAQTLIDDDFRHMPNKPVEGLEGVLFGLAKRVNIPSHIVIARDWVEVLDYARKKAA